MPSHWGHYTHLWCTMLYVGQSQVTSYPQKSWFYHKKSVSPNGLAFGSGGGIHTCLGKKQKGAC